MTHLDKQVEVELCFSITRDVMMLHSKVTVHQGWLAQGFWRTVWLAHNLFNSPLPKGTMGLVFVKLGNRPTHPSHPPAPALALPDQSQPRPHCLPVGRFETTAASLCALTSIMGMLTQGRQRPLPLRSSRSKLVRHAGAERLASKFGEVELAIKEEEVRDVLGIGTCICALALPVWHVMPLFLDLKIAQDPSLPGLSTETLPITTTAIFVGWLASAVILDRALEVFDKKQLLMIHIIGLLLVTLATITLPHLTAGNLVVFTAVRFIHGLLMNITALQCMYLQERMPSKGNQVLVFNSIMYSIFTVLMSWSCSQLTLTMDWRLEFLLWGAIPLILGVVIAFPDWWNILQSLPAAFRNHQEASPVAKSGEGISAMTSEEQRAMVAMSVGFLACGCGFYGLNYSAGQLSPSVYVSTSLLHGGDIVGYMLALSADRYGRNLVQALAFFTAAMCLLLCSTGEPGSALVLSAAVMGRLCLDVCFTTVYVGLGAIFSGSGAKTALMICEATARLGGIIAPLSGTWPTSVSCPVFASACLAAAYCSMTLPQSRILSSKSLDASTDTKQADCSGSEPILKVVHFESC